MKETNKVMTMIDTREPHSEPRRLPVIARLGPKIAWMGRVLYLLGAALFAACVVLQVFFAGAGVLVHPSYWSMHRSFGAIVVPLSFALLPIGIVGWLPWRMHALNLLVIVLFVMQFIFLWVLGKAVGVPALRALHAVNALALFWLTLHLTRSAWRLLRTARHAPV
jgi:uncharacterized protein DUF6220